MNGHMNGSTENVLNVKVISSFTAHRNDVLSVVWTGNMVASGSADKTIRIWRINQKDEQNIELHEVPFSPIADHIYHVQCLHFSSFGTFLVECSSDGVIMVWNTTTGKKIGQVNLPSNTISAARTCRISPDSRYIAAGGDNDCVALWAFDKTAGLQLQKVYEGHEASVTCLCFTHDSAFILSGGMAGDIRIWDRNKDQAIYIQRDAHDLGCTCMDIAPYKLNSPNGSTALHVASGGYDNTVKLWHLIELPNGNMKLAISPGNCHLKGHSGDICSVRFANQTKLLISCSSDRTLFVWDPVKAVALKRVGPLTKYVRSCCFSSNDQFMMAGFSGGIVGFWRISTNTGAAADVEPPVTITQAVNDNKIQLEFLDDDNAPSEFLCPVTNEIMRDPVIALDGISYEKTALEAWFKKGNSTSPTTNTILSSQLFIPNVNLKLLIDRWHVTRKSSCA
ncbi:WD repeat, SAM and U-box domain-containing protein 1-like [Paramacrobiotus metropolitanus]|uniref:WD repeat, SAM and U-box domain-containing protein 1-like n=1 Tax=Paramacrobiotus metropolitanus TaxID=2943436 RepID=UPI002445B453|nr:WD repeat, SAM and U-box domain-containing protein 1-like [Paramacrobiotus metropolitanus]XP_055338096.1 WD repeat, SAM and U-box domain-containing protein 1-like [Paramacrobiotus metropolitanus]